MTTTMQGTSSGAITPTEEELKNALTSLKSSNPSLGISKTHALLLSTYPLWAVSEKRTRKILQNAGLVVSAPDSGDGAGQRPGKTIYPSSRLIPNLDVTKWTPKVSVKYFDKIKGKGLVATEDIKSGETIWKEDPFIIAPEWEIYDLQLQSRACGYCTTPFSSLTAAHLIIPCPSASSSSPIAHHSCPFVFCNRLCLTRSLQTHPLVCPAQNPASVPLLKFARETQWMALHALAQLTSRILLASQGTSNKNNANLNKTGVEKDWDVVRGLAELGMEERLKYSFGLAAQSEPDKLTWKKAHTLYVQCFQEPQNPSDKKRLQRLLKKPLVNPEIQKTLFDYDSGFLKGLGKMSLNLEAHGGLYTLHSHINHSCDPNVSVRHLDQRTALSRITIIAKRDIKAGEELFITYVNPELGVKARRRELLAWGFGECRCRRCVEEETTLPSPDEAHPTSESVDMEDLANELKAGLGVM